MAKKQTKKSGTAAIPSWVLLVGAVVLLGAAAIGVWVLLAPQSQGGIGPVLQVSQERIDLGKYPFEKMVRAEFQVKNVGDRTLTLDVNAPVRAVEGC